MLLDFDFRQKYIRQTNRHRVAQSPLLPVVDFFYDRPATWAGTGKRFLVGCLLAWFADGVVFCLFCLFVLGGHTGLFLLHCAVVSKTMVLTKL